MSAGPTSGRCRRTSGSLALAHHHGSGRSFTAMTGVAQLCRRHPRLSPGCSLTFGERQYEPVRSDHRVDPGAGDPVRLHAVDLLPSAQRHPAPGLGFRSWLHAEAGELHRRTGDPRLDRGRSCDLDRRGAGPGHRPAGGRPMKEVDPHAARQGPRARGRQGRRASFYRSARLGDCASVSRSLVPDHAARRRARRL